MTMMRMINRFLKNKSGNLVQFLVAVVILGALSYTFWANWEVSIKAAGVDLKQKIEADVWLSE